jgi:hypothetical protein
MHIMRADAEVGARPDDFPLLAESDDHAVVGLLSCVRAGYLVLRGMDIKQDYGGRVSVRRCCESWRSTCTVRIVIAYRMRI